MFHRFPPDLLEIGNRLPLTSLLNDPLQPFPLGIVEYDDISPSVIADAKLLCREAMRQVCSYLSASPLYAEVQQGKMLGVLLCRKPSSGEVGFLAAYSGQLGGREDWPWFVPAVFDYLQPDGHFKQEEARISDVGKHIVELQQGERRLSLCAELENLRQQAADAIDAYRWEMALAKRRRDEQRRAGGDEALLTRESQFQKAEMRRMKQMWAARISEEEARLKPIDEEISALAGERRERSERLQQWLFDRFVMLNDGGESRTLTSIFADTPQRVPPSGAGECCAPKLFQYAFANGLQPLVIAEFWQGASPRMEIRHHGQCYAACRGKCKPILEWMLEELRVLGGAKRQSRAKSEEFMSRKCNITERMNTLDRQILRLALPSIVTNITVPLLGLCDVAVMGHVGGATSIGAISVGSMIFNVMYWLFVFLRMSTSGLTAQAFGAGRWEEAKVILRRTLLMALSAGSVIVVLQVPLRHLSFFLMQATPDVVALCMPYYHICVWGAPAMLGLYVLTGWLIGMQNTRYPMVIAISQNIVNIAVSLILVLGFGMGIKGVALGTLVAQWAGFLAALAMTGMESRRRGMNIFAAETSKSNGDEDVRQSTKSHVRLNVNIFLRTLCLVSVNLYFTSAGAAQGALVLAANTLLIQLYLMYSYMTDGFAFAGEALSGRYLGAGDAVMLRLTVRRLFMWGWALAVFFTVAYSFGGTTLLALLTSDAMVVECANSYLPWVLLIPAAGTAAFVWDGIFIGTTQSQGMLVACLWAALVFFALWLTLSPMLGNHALWLSLIVYLAVRGLVQMLLWHRHPPLIR